MTETKKQEAIAWAIECMSHYSDCDISDRDRKSISEAKDVINSLITTIESLQGDMEAAEIVIKSYREEVESQKAFISDLQGQRNRAGDLIREKNDLIESQKEEIERYNGLFQEIGIMCAFDQPPQILRILAVLQKFQQEGDK